jgi:hypothetical protein
MYFICWSCYVDQHIGVVDHFSYKGINDVKAVNR